MSPARALAVAGLVLASTAASSAAPGADLLIRNARLLDGTGAPPRAPLAILVRGGRIERIAAAIDADGVPVLDVGGATVLPGLIDAHVHMAAAPGSAFRGDSPATVARLNRQHLRAYLANGVTTILDPGSPLESVQAVQQWLAAGNPGPRYLTTGPMLRVPGGYGAESHGVLRTPADVDRALDLIQSIGGVGVKLNTEHGFAPVGGSLPQYPPEIRQAIVEGARRRRLPLYVHAMSERDAAKALDLGAHAIMHAPMGGPWAGQFFGVSDLSDDFVERMVSSGAYQLTTFSLLDTWPGLYDPARLDDARVRLTVPEVELATARNADAARAFAISLLGAAVPWTFEFTRPWLARQLWSRDNLEQGLRYSQRNVARLHRAGIPIVAATDAPSVWPDAIYHFHGPQTAREVELLGEAGLSNLDAIAAATTVPARMLGLDAETGTVEVGKLADLLVVDGDPAIDLRALRAVRWTVRDGVAKTPAQWMGS